VATKIAGTNQVFDARSSVENNARELELLLGAILVIFNVRHSDQKITRQCITEWMEEFIVPDDFGDMTINHIAGRVIASLR